MPVMPKRTKYRKMQKGRNRGIHVSDMDNYIEMKKQIEAFKNYVKKQLENFNFEKQIAINYYDTNQ